MIDKTREELKQPSRANIEYIIDYFKKRLQVVNTAAIKAESFDTDQYDDLLDLYDFLTTKETFTMSEMDSIISEIGKIRKK